MARYLGVAPWELAEQRPGWIHAAQVAMAAEAAAQKSAADRAATRR